MSAVRGFKRSAKRQLLSAAGWLALCYALLASLVLFLSRRGLVSGGAFQLMQAASFVVVPCLVLYFFLRQSASRSSQIRRSEQQLLMLARAVESSQLD